MRVLVNLEDREVVVQLGHLEVDKLINGKLTLKNIGALYEYDDEIYYAMPYVLTLKKVGDFYTLNVERVDAVGEFHKYCTLKFKNLAELTVAVDIAEKKCCTKITKKEREILKQYMVEHRDDIVCAVLLDLDIYNVAKRMIEIARKLHLF